MENIDVISNISSLLSFYDDAAVHAKYLDKNSVGVSLEAVHILTFAF